MPFADEGVGYVRAHFSVDATFAASAPLRATVEAVLRNVTKNHAAYIAQRRGNREQAGSSATGCA